jgi:catechol 2,3-dioxygenase-like lactoylglutathione lyase family enzyme
MLCEMPPGYGSHGQHSFRLRGYSVLRSPAEIATHSRQLLIVGASSPTHTYYALEFRNMGLKRMDNVGIVVADLAAAIDFFLDIGLELEGRAMIEGEWAGRVTGLGDQHVEIAMMRTPDGHGRLELSRFLRPHTVEDHRSAPVNALGYLRVMFAVDDIDETLMKLRKRGAQLVGEVVRYEDTYRLCYIRGPEGLLIGLAQELG